VLHSIPSKSVASLVTRPFGGYLAVRGLLGGKLADSNKMNRLLVDGISAKASTSALLGGRVVVRAEESIT
jgi:hypothetical protein